MAVAHRYCLNMFVWYCLLSSLNKANTLHIKRKLWRWMPTVIERAHSDQSSLWTVIVSVDQVDWQIMHIYKQPLRHRHTLIILFLSASFSLYLSKTNIHTHLHLISPSSFKEGPGVTMRTGINLRKHRKAALSTQITTPAAPGAKGCVCVYVCASVLSGICVHVCQCVDVQILVLKARK